MLVAKELMASAFAMLLAIGTIGGGGVSDAVSAPSARSFESSTSMDRIETCPERYIMHA